MDLTQSGHILINITITIQKINMKSITVIIIQSIQNIQSIQSIQSIQNPGKLILLKSRINQKRLND